MRKGRLKTFIALSLALALTLSTIPSPLLADTNHHHEASLETPSTETGTSSTMEDINPDQDTPGSDPKLQNPQNQSVAEQTYAPILLDRLPSGANDYKTNRFIVKFKNEQSKSTLTAAISEDLKQLKNFKYHRFKDFSVITTKTAMKQEDLVTKINNQNAGSAIAYIQPDYQLTAASLDAETAMQQNDLPEHLQGLPSTPTNTGTPVDLADINLKAAWSKSQGEGAIVAVLDTGIDTTHRDLAHRIWSNTAETAGNGIDDDGNGYIDDTTGWNFPGNNSAVHKSGHEYDEWHGTHIAGIIAGVAPDATIMPLKIFKNGTAYTSDIIEAIAYAEEKGAKVANCSWGISFDNPALKEAIVHSNMLFICASGNSHTNIDANPVYPGSYRGTNIITVASLNKDGKLSGYSNYGKTTVNVAAPGENIISATPGNRNGKSSGTSQAAAFVSGEAALILGKHKNASASEIRQVIIESSDQMPNLTNQIISGNKINCGRAVSSPFPANKEPLINEHNKDISVDSSVYKDISVTDLVYVDTTDTEFIYGDTTDSESVYQTTERYSLYSGEIWNIKASMPTARYGLAAAAVNGKIYAIGGYNDVSGYLNTLEEYNPATNTWTTKASMPTARTWLAAAAVNGKIYAIGGINNYNTKLNTIEEYDPATDTWMTKASMPTSRCLLAAAAVNGKIYVIGGNNNNGFLNTVEEYDPVANTWTTKANMPTSRNYLAAAVINGKIYAIGGFNDSLFNSLNTIEEYHPVTNTWTAKVGMPMPRFVLSAAAANEKIYAIGGRHFYDGDTLNLLEEYDPVTNTWTTKASMPTARGYLAAAAAGTKIYAIGGFNNSIGTLNTVEELSLPSVDSYQYQYDANNCLDYIITPPGQTIDYQYDANGNLLRRILTQ
ncbi:Thermophilic serine proteinase precursor [Sporotomaculum syntrophicum]|uniref:Thermophilic serine proteinase n=1 Tax=Sporotomaculum syntrophicum TaxID=182264 RepID=A0A9D2WQ61_9FIRM|nr:S8 family serine peptidase [Sporotomaculum syntrophicum]KAF1084886.1 Thermophilic serine proteinase precursor [Sporotomaculum syntrophicum]